MGSSLILSSKELLDWKLIKPLSKNGFDSTGAVYYWLDLHKYLQNFQRCSFAWTDLVIQTLCGRKSSAHIDQVRNLLLKYQISVAVLTETIFFPPHLLLDLKGKRQDLSYLCIMILLYVPLIVQQGSTKLTQSPHYGFSWRTCNKIWTSS